MENIKQHWEQLCQHIKNHPTTAEQGLDLKTTAPGQLHWPAVPTDEPDMFYLIVDVFDDYSEVIPGSFDYMMACSDDIILPKSVFGKFAFLSLNLAATLPDSAIGKGFAVLDDDTFNRIIDSHLEYETGEKGELPSFPFAALPYASESDPRKFYHDHIVDIIISGQQKMVAAVFPTQQPILNPILNPIFPDMALAAGEQKRNPYQECHIDGFNGLLAIEYDLDAKRLIIKCFDSGGNISLFYDGWFICDSDGNKLGIIEDGKLSINGVDDFDGGLSAIDEFYNIYPIIAIKNNGEK